MIMEEKQKAIDALKISAPVMTVTQEEFNDYIQTLNKIMDWLEQAPKSEWEHDHEILKAYSDGASAVCDKIRAEIDKQAKWLLQAGYTTYNVDIAFSSIKSVLAESEEKI